MSHLEVTDKESFIQFVADEIQKSILLDHTMEDYLGFNKSSPKEQKHIFLDKAQALIQKLIEIDHFDMVLPMLVLLKTGYRLNNRRSREGGHLKEGHRRIDALIKAVVTREIPDAEEVTIDYWEPRFDVGYRNGRKDGEKDDEGEVDPMKYECTIDVDGLGWSIGARDPSKDYWNFSLCARLLRDAYIVRDPKKSDDCEEWIFGNDTCFHQQSIDMLQWLQRKAWSEVRTSVMLTAGTKLPAELTERAFEYALVEEGIPANPEVKEIVLVDVPEWMDEEDKDRLGITGPRPFETYKQEYCCYRVPRGDLISVFYTPRNAEEYDFME